MKRVAGLFVCMLTVVWFSEAAATPSVNGATVTENSPIIDAQGDVWEIMSGVIVKNGARVGNNYNVDLLLEYNQAFYQRNTSNEWYRWTGTVWSATGDPRVASANAARTGIAGVALVDAKHNVWMLASDQIAYESGARAGGNYNTISLLYYNSVIYCENSNDEWYSWNGSAWAVVAADPTSDTKQRSANGATISVASGTLVDASGNVWTVGRNEYAYENGARAGGNYNTILVLVYNGMIYSENGSGDWYSWNGSKWARVSGDPEGSGTALGSSDPRGPNLVQYATYTSPVCPAGNPSCVPPFEGDSSVTFTKVTTKGNAIWVAATVSDYGGIHSITVTDSQNNTYHMLNQVNDGRPGSQTVAHFYAANVAGGPDTITVNWSADNYKGVVAAEIAGVTGSPLVNNNANIQDGQLSLSDGNVTSRGMTVTAASNPSLRLALTMDTNGGASDVGGSGFCALPAGPGFTLVTQLWDWSPSGSQACNLATLETRTVTASGAVTGEFTSPYLSDPYVTVGVVFH